MILRIRTAQQELSCMDSFDYGALSCLLLAVCQAVCVPSSC